MSPSDAYRPLCFAIGMVSSWIFNILWSLTRSHMAAGWLFLCFGTIYGNLGYLRMCICTSLFSFVAVCGVRLYRLCEPGFSSPIRHFFQRLPPQAASRRLSKPEYRWVSAEIRVFLIKTSPASNVGRPWKYLVSYVGAAISGEGSQVISSTALRPVAQCVTLYRRGPLGDVNIFPVSV